MCWNSLGVRAAFLSCICALAVAVTPSWAQSDEGTPLAVVVDQLPKREILSLGQFSAGETAKVTIALQGDLGRPLSILSIATDCGCLRVNHAPQAITDDGPLILEVELAPAHKVGRLRRNVRVFFEQERSSPLDIGLDTLVVGPIAFESTHAAVGSTSDAIVIAGVKKSPGIDLLNCEPTRGSCRTLAVEQTPESFSVRVVPSISFGSVHELFRIRYQEQGEPKPVTLDLPLELRCVSPLRFFPSVAAIEFDDDAWRADAKLVLAPGSNLKFDQLQLSIESADGTRWSPSEYNVEIMQSSAVLFAMHVNCSAPHRDSNPPARLNVASPRGERLATLVFSSP